MRPLLVGSWMAAVAACTVKTELPTDTVETGDTGTIVTTPTPTPTTPQPTTPFDAFADADLTNAAVVQGLSVASAAQLFGLHYTPVIDAISVDDPKCPVVTTSTNVTDVTGGCTDTDGVTWFGSAHAEVVDPTNLFVDLVDFGRDVAVACTGGGSVVRSERLTGHFDLPGKSYDAFALATEGQFTTVDPTACTAVTRTFRAEYAGARESGYILFQGEGTYADDVFGRVSAQTVDEVLDGACDTEATSGTTTLTSGADVATIVYDGLTDCDLDSTVTWQLNGEDQGEIRGVACATGGPGGGAMLLALLAATYRRRAGTQTRSAVPPR